MSDAKVEKGKKKKTESRGSLSEEKKMNVIGARRRRGELVKSVVEIGKAVKRNGRGRH
jgi:hypothetical protein